MFMFLFLKNFPFTCFWCYPLPGLILVKTGAIWMKKMGFFLYLIEQADGDAALGKYVAGSCVGAAAEYDLFIKNHSY